MRDEAAAGAASGDGDCEDGGASDEEELQEGPHTPGRMLVELLVEHMMFGRLSSKQCCVLMHWAEKAGVGEAKKFALNPQASSGHFGRKLRSVLGYTNSQGLYEMEVPGRQKHGIERCPVVLPCLPLHEQIASDLEESPRLTFAVREWIASKDVPPAYWEHPVVRSRTAAEPPPVPIAIFIDAVPYSLTDSILGFWGLNLLNQQRYLFAAVRKRHMCSCGCKTWCTMFPLHCLTRWSLEALAAGTWPSSRHDGSAWKASDGRRADRAGKPMVAKCACLFLKGDWAEYAHSIGLPTWQDGIRPCFKCNACGPDMFVAAGNSLRGLRWTETARGAHDTACRSCEVSVFLADLPGKQNLLSKLMYNKSDTGPRGRALIEGVDAYPNLRPRDRLEPSRHLHDIGTLEGHPLPSTVICWRRSEETLWRHRNPLFGYGCSSEDNAVPDPVDFLTVDPLHALYLGVLKIWARNAMWCLFESGAYGCPASNQENLLKVVLVFRAVLFSWYSQRAREFKLEGLTRVSDFTPKMAGSCAEHALKTKGAETWGVSLFLLRELRRFASRCGSSGQRLLRAGEELETIVLIWRRYEWVLPDAAIEEKAKQSENKHQEQQKQTLLNW